MKISLSVDSWSDLFGELGNNPKQVCWVSSLDYRQQLYVSPSFQSLCGVSEKILYDDISVFGDFIVSDNRDQLISSWAKRHLERESGAVIYQIKSRDATVKYIRDKYMTLYDENGAPMAAAGIAVDITEKIGFGCDDKMATWVLDEYQETHAAYASILKDKLALLTEQPPSTLNELTEREKCCVKQLLLGKSAQQTADALFISVRTVEKHLENIKKKFNCARKLDLLKLLIEGKYL